GRGSLVPIFRQELHNQARQGPRNVRVHPRWRFRLVSLKSEQKGSRCGSPKRQNARAHVIENCSETEEIATGVDSIAARLLRRRGAGGPDASPHAAPRRTAANSPCQAEVEELHATHLPL